MPMPFNAQLHHLLESNFVFESNSMICYAGGKYILAQHSFQTLHQLWSKLADKTIVRQIKSSYTELPTTRACVLGRQKTKRSSHLFICMNLCFAKHENNHIVSPVIRNVLLKMYNYFTNIIRARELYRNWEIFAIGRR